MSTLVFLSSVLRLGNVCEGNKKDALRAAEGTRASRVSSEQHVTLGNRALSQHYLTISLVLRRFGCTSGNIITYEYVYKTIFKKRGIIQNWKYLNFKK